MEKLIIIAIILGASIVHNWFKRRQEEAEERKQAPPGSAPPPRQPPPAPPRGQPSGGWEEELRRLLGGEPAAPPQPKPRPAPPPMPPPMAPRPARAPEPAAPRPFLARSAIPVPEMGREMDVGLSVRPVLLDQASAAHQRASRLQAAVQQRMQDTTSRVSGHSGVTLVARRATNADRLRPLLRQKESQRTLILASVILGPPRAIDP